MYDQKLPSVLDELSSDKSTQNNTHQHKEAAGSGEANAWKFLAISFVRRNFNILLAVVTVKQEARFLSHRVEERISQTKESE